MFAALNNVFNLKWEEKSSKDRYKHVQIVKKNYIHSVAILPDQTGI